MINAADIHIVKTADAAQVNAGEQIGFTLTVYNTGSGDAKGVTLTDTLPTNPGLDWSIAGQGAGWGGTCAIRLGVADLRPGDGAGGDDAGRVDVHGAHHLDDDCCDGRGLPGRQWRGQQHRQRDDDERRLGSVDAPRRCVAAPAIHIVKTADAAQVNAGEQIGFTLTVYNTGTGDAKGVTLSDAADEGGSGLVDRGQGAGWGGTCAIAAGTLTCGPETVPAGTTQAASTFTVHITSTTTAATGGVCPEGSGVVDNTGHVTTTNDGSDQSTRVDVCALRRRSRS